MGKEWRSVSFTACLSFVVFLFFSPAAFGQAPIKLNYSVFFPAHHIHSVLAVEWGKEIEKRTNGRVKVDVFPGGTLTPADKCYDGVEKGTQAILRGRNMTAKLSSRPSEASGGIFLLISIYKRCKFIKIPRLISFARNDTPCHPDHPFCHPERSRGIF